MVFAMLAGDTLKESNRLCEIKVPGLYSVEILTKMAFRPKVISFHRCLVDDFLCCSDVRLR